MDKIVKRLIISILFIIFGIVFVSTTSPYLDTLAIFLLVIGGIIFGNAITEKINE